ncbi:hypothetical protein [Clostridium sp. JS66]|nr:hypothetical protein [Clostridium sp. JS66]WPC42611.1 hypothetical protein Q6H37_03835 [Clostridium sp. JS66]
MEYKILGDILTADDGEEKKVISVEEYLAKDIMISQLFLKLMLKRLG